MEIDGIAAGKWLVSLFQREMSRSDRGILMDLRHSRWTSTLNVTLKSFFENPVIVIHKKDLSTHRSCSDF